MSRSTWIERLPEINEMIEMKVPMDEIGEKYGVSRQRIYQVLRSFGLKSYIERKRSRYGFSPKKLWLDRVLMAKKVPVAERHKILEVLELPDVCPMLGFELKYVSGRAKGDGEGGWSGRRDDSPSIDQIEPRKGYVLGNIQVVSWRANRLKSDATPDELLKIGHYMKSLNEN